MTFSPKVKKIWNIATTIIVALVIIMAVLLVGVRLVGLQPYTVLSGSMEPTYHTGSLIYVKNVKPQEVEVGQPITFVLNEDLVVATHRVVEIDEENQHFYTKGDANTSPDGSPVHFNNLIGVPVFSIPYLGYVATFIQTPPGLYITIAAGAVLLLLIFLPDLLRICKKDTER
jgi:signal peptidase I